MKFPTCFKDFWDRVYHGIGTVAEPWPEVEDVMTKPEVQKEIAKVYDAGSCTRIEIDARKSKYSSWAEVFEDPEMQDKIKQADATYKLFRAANGPETFKKGGKNFYPRLDDEVTVEFQGKTYSGMISWIRKFGGTYPESGNFSHMELQTGDYVFYLAQKEHNTEKLFWFPLDAITEITDR